MWKLLLAPALALAAATLPAQTPPTDAGEPIVIGRVHRFHSTILTGDRRIAVYLPPHYDEPRRRIPVIYLLDGGPAEDFHHITGLVAIASAYGSTQEAIVVGIEGVDRRHDLTGPTDDPADRKAAPTAGGAAAYRRFLIDELKPWVAAHYHTGGRSMLMGESLAGLFVLDTLLDRPDAFDDYVAVSPSLWWNREALSRTAAAALRRPGFAGHRLWLADADERRYAPAMKAGVDRFAAALQASGPAGLQWTYTPMPGETHATIYHPAAMAAIRTLLAAPRTP